jgi:hypothetical protein
MTVDHPDRPSVPGIIPEAVHVRHDNAGATTVRRDAVDAHRQNPVRRAVERLLSALRGDQYMVDAYPVAPPVNVSEHDGALASPAVGSPDNLKSGNSVK